MAGWSVGSSLYQQSVVVAVHHYVNQMQEVAACFALGPQAVTTTTPECYLLSFDGLLVGLLVHVAKHQYVFGLGILYDSGNKSTALFKIYFHCCYLFLFLLRIIFCFFHIIYILTFIPSDFKYCFSSGMGISPKWNTLAASAASA